MYLQYVLERRDGKRFVRVDARIPKARPIRGQYVEFVDEASVVEAERLLTEKVSRMPKSAVERLSPQS